MMIKTTLTCALTLAFLTACAPSRNAAPSTATARDSLDWAGSYEGVLPCADCPGIHARDPVRQRPLRKADPVPGPPAPARSRGRHLSWESDGSTIRLDASGDSHATSSAKPADPAIP